MPDDLHQDPETQLRAARPIHCVSRDGTVKIIRRTGRPKKIAPRPDADQNEYAREVSEIADKFITSDELVLATAVDHQRDDPAVLDRSLLELAREQAALHFNRERLTREGKDVGQVSSRRVEALARIANLVLERARLGPQDFDHRSDKFQKVANLFFEQMDETARETLGPEVSEEFLARFRKEIAGWEDRIG